MVLLRRQSACVARNMQEMQSSNSWRYYVAQMWVLGAILLLTTTVFTVNAEHAELNAGDALQVCIYIIYLIFIFFFSKY